MSDTALNSDRVLDTAEDVMRRFGPAKATVVDVARALHVSHRAIYRYFSSKTALRDAVVARWLDRVSAPLDVIAKGSLPPSQKLRLWFDTLIQVIQDKVRADPEMFAAYRAVSLEDRAVIQTHAGVMIAQLARIVLEGQGTGTFADGNPHVIGRALYQATVRFHDPLHQRFWHNPDCVPSFQPLWSMMMLGLEM